MEKSGKRMRARSLLLQKPRINKLLSVRKDRDCYRVRLVTRSKRDPCMRRDVTIWRHGTEIGNCIWPIIDRTNSSSVVQLKIRRITKNSSSYLSCRIFCNLFLSLSLSLSQRIKTGAPIFMKVVKGNSYLSRQYLMILFSDGTDSRTTERKRERKNLKTVTKRLHFNFLSLGKITDQL